MTPSIGFRDLHQSLLKFIENKKEAPYLQLGYGESIPESLKGREFTYYPVTGTESEYGDTIIGIQVFEKLGTSMVDFFTAAVSEKVKEVDQVSEIMISGHEINDKTANDVLGALGVLFVLDETV